MRLVEISRNGTPAEPLGSVPDIVGRIGAAYAELYATGGYAPPWIGYVALHDDVCVGTCGFKGPPAMGRVEIAYFTFAEFEGKGYATWMARALAELALERDAALVVAAQTLPNESASTTILRRLGFELHGTVNHPIDGPVWEWQYHPHATEPSNG